MFKTPPVWYAGTAGPKYFSYNEVDAKGLWERKCGYLLMRLVPQEGLWPDFIAADGQGDRRVRENQSVMEGGKKRFKRDNFTDKFQNNNDQSCSSASVSIFICLPSMLFALRVTNVPFPAVCLNCVF